MIPLFHNMTKERLFFSKIQKLIEKFYERPLRNDLTFNEIQKISEHYGCKVISGGNHMKVAHIPSGTIIPIPRHGNCVKEAYIKQLCDLFDSIEPKEE